MRTHSTFLRFEMDFVFLSTEGGETKRLIVETLEMRLPFIDVGLGYSAPAIPCRRTRVPRRPLFEMRGHIRDKKRIDFSSRRQ